MKSASGMSAPGILAKRPRLSLLKSPLGRNAPGILRERPKLWACGPALGKGPVFAEPFGRGMHLASYENSPHSGVVALGFGRAPSLNHPGACDRGSKRQCCRVSGSNPKEYILPI